MNNYTPDFKLIGVEPQEILDKLWDSELIYLTLIREDGSWVYPSSHLCNLLEYTKEELESMTYMDVTDPLDLRADIESAKEVAKGNINNYIITKRYITKTGKRVWVKLLVSGLHDKNGNFLMFLSQLLPTDITETPITKNNMPTKNYNMENHIKHFLKDNARWILPLIGSFILALWGAAREWAKLEHELETYKNQHTEKIK